LDGFIYNDPKIGASILTEGIETVAEYDYLKKEKDRPRAGVYFW
jgi:hypothetical protein